MTRLTEAGARNMGWRFFRGLSQTGKPLDDVICPVCSDRGPEPDVPSWDIRCRACGWLYLEQYFGEEPDIPVIDVRDALKALAEHHEPGNCLVVDVARFEVLVPGEQDWKLLSDVISQSYARR